MKVRRWTSLPKLLHRINKTVGNQFRYLFTCSTENDARQNELRHEKMQDGRKLTANVTRNEGNIQVRSESDEVSDAIHKRENRTKRIWDDSAVDMTCTTSYGCYVFDVTSLKRRENFDVHVSRVLKKKKFWHIQYESRPSCTQKRSWIDHKV